MSVRSTLASLSFFFWISSKVTVTKAVLPCCEGRYEFCLNKGTCNMPLLHFLLQDIRFKNQNPVGHRNEFGWDWHYFKKIPEFFVHLHIFGVVIHTLDLYLMPNLPATISLFPSFLHFNTTPFSINVHGQPARGSGGTEPGREGIVIFGSDPGWLCNV